MISPAIVLVTIIPLQPAFLIFVLVVAGPAAIAYPYWRDLRGWRTWWRGARPWWNDSAVSYLYLGIIAAFVLPDATVSWGTLGGQLAIAVGTGFAVGTWVDLPKKPSPHVPGQRRRNCGTQHVC